MKKTLSAVFVAACLGTANLAMAVSPAPTDAAEAPEAAMQEMRDSLTGLVAQAGDGLILQTSEGDYAIKGMDLNEVIGQEVEVTGIIQSEDDTQVIYVVKATPKQ